MWRREIARRPDHLKEPCITESFLVEATPEDGLQQPGKETMLGLTGSRKLLRLARDKVAHRELTKVATGSMLPWTLAICSRSPTSNRRSTALAY